MDTFPSPLSIDPSRLQRRPVTDSLDARCVSDVSATQQAGQESVWGPGGAPAVALMLVGGNELARGQGELGATEGLATADGRQFTFGAPSQYPPTAAATFSSSTSPAELYSASLGFSTHRRSSSSASSTSSSSFSIHSGGAYRRETSTRRARAGSVPYFHPHSQAPQGYFDGLELGEDGRVAFGRLAIASSGSSAGGENSRRSSLSAGSWGPYKAGEGEGREQSVENGDALGSLNISELLKEASSEGMGAAEGGESYKGGENEEDARCMREARMQLDSATRTLQTATTISALDRAKNDFVQIWISASYSLDENGTASRQGVYGSYVKECEARGLRAINAASFGKAIRAKWPQLKTRRLGSRTTSRYHYVGMRPAHSVELARMNNCDAKGHLATSTVPSSGEEEADELEDEQLGAPPSEPLYFSREPADYHSDSSPALVGSDRPSLYWTASSASAAPTTPMTARPPATRQEDIYFSYGSHGRPGGLSISIPQGSPGAYGGETTLGGAASAVVSSPSEVMKSFPSIKEVLGGGTGEGGPVREFWTSFGHYAAGLLRSMQARRFNQFELTIRTWWATLTAEQVALVNHPLVSQLIYRGELALYENCLDFLHDEISAGMAAEDFVSLRGLADRMEQTQRFALAPFDGSSFSAPKLALAARFAHLLKRHLGLSQLAQAFGGVLENAETLQAMKDAWELIDLESIRSQVDLLFDQDREVLETLEGLGHLFESEPQLGIQTFIDWIQTSFHHLDDSSPKQQLLRWSFACKEVIRDLTLRSDPAFGSFHIAFSFIDELLSFRFLRRDALQVQAMKLDLPSNYDQATTNAVSPPDRSSYPPSIPSHPFSTCPAPAPVTSYSALGGYGPFSEHDTSFSYGQSPTSTRGNRGAVYQQLLYSYSPAPLGVPQQRESFDQGAAGESGERDYGYEGTAWGDAGESQGRYRGAE